MPEMIEPTFFDTRNYQNPEANCPPGIDPFENADESVLVWASNTRARLAAKRAAKLKRLNGDRDLDDLPVIETSSSLLSDEPLPVIEAIEQVDIEGSSQMVGRDRDLPVIEHRKGDDPQAIPEKSKPKNSGCVGTYRKGKSEYYRYSCRIDGKVKHRHIGEKRSEHAQHTVILINRWILTDIPSRWILWNFFNGPDYPERDNDFHESYKKLMAYPYQPPSPPPSPPDPPKPPKTRFDDL